MKKEILKDLTQAIVPVVCSMTVAYFTNRIVINLLKKVFA